MRLLIQRVNHASVKVDGEVIGNIGKGFLVLVGIGQNDTREVADKYMKKMLGLRIFEDENGKTNLSLADVNGELLMVSQFTLYANCKKGNRPSFIEAGAPEQAYENFTGKRWTVYSDAGRIDHVKLTAIVTKPAKAILKPVRQMFRIVCDCIMNAVEPSIIF